MPWPRWQPSDPGRRRRTGAQQLLGPFLSESAGTSGSWARMIWNARFARQIRHWFAPGPSASREGPLPCPATPRRARRGSSALPTLDAAHIRPVAEGGQHCLDNGLLLRTDVHRLFDAGYVTVTPDGRFLVSRRLKDDFDNGEPYMPFHGQRIWMPGDPVSQPNREALEWHSEGVFLG
jgi:hypothetical protein